MFESLLVWKKIMVSPSEGFREVDENTKVFIPIILLLIVALIAVSFVVPITTSKVYIEKSLSLQLTKMKAKGMNISMEQARKGAESGVTKTITLVSAYAGNVIVYLITFYLGAFVLWLLVKIFKAGEVSYKLLFRVVVFSAIVTVIGGLINGLIVYFSDWRAAVASATNVSELGDAVKADLSLAAFFDRTTLGKIPFYLLDYVTSIFNILYFVLIYYGLVFAGKVKSEKAVSITVIFGILSSIPGFVSIMFV